MYKYEYGITNKMFRKKGFLLWDDKVKQFRILDLDLAKSQQTFPLKFILFYVLFVFHSFNLTHSFISFIQ